MLCECSSAGRAQPCQGWGRAFESRHSLNNYMISLYHKFTSSFIGQFIANLTMLISGPGVILGGVWLLISGEWSLVGIGFLWIMFSGYIISITLLPGVLIDFISSLFEDYPLLNYIFIFLSCVYTNFIMVFMCLIMFQIIDQAYFISPIKNLHNLPYYLWLWGIAIAPWQGVLSSDMDRNSYFYNKSYRLRKDLETVNVLILIIFYLGFLFTTMSFSWNSNPALSYSAFWFLTQILLIPALQTYSIYRDNL